MYITKIVLNKHLSATQKLLSNRHFIHGAVEACFNEADGERKLWRLSLKGKDPELFIISRTRPDAQHFLERYSRKAESSVQIKDYTGIVNGVEAGKEYRIQIEANPTKMKSRKRDIIPLISETDISNWFERHGKNNGFSVIGGILQTKNPQTLIYKGKRKITSQTVQIDGLVKVENVEQFQKFLMNGIGRNKAYGFGMPMVAPI